MLNPALIAVIIGQSANAYSTQRREPMPWSLAFVVATMVLHSPTRDALPTSTRTHLSTWLLNNPRISAGFSYRTESLRDRVLEGLRFGLRHQHLSIQSSGIVAPKIDLKEVSGELQVLLKKAELAGRWLAKVQGVSTVYSLLGMKV